jgi:glycosyltransferase involved in cell wall biosynthesis
LREARCGQHHYHTKIGNVDLTSAGAEKVVSTALDISVVVALYNKEEHVRESIASALAQSFTRFELIVVDDGSTDRSAAVVESMSSSNLRLISQTNSGVSAARNRGMRDAAADWVAFLDADDLWLQDHLAQLWQTHEAFPQAALIANQYTTIAAKPGSDGRNVRRRMTSNFIDEAARGEAWVFTSAAMVRKDVAVGIGGFAEGESRGEDIDLWVRMALQQPVALSSYVGTVYHQVKNSLTATITVLEPDVAMRRIARRLADDSDLTPEVGVAMRELANRLALSHASDCLVRGHKEAARAFIAGARETRYWASRRRILFALSLLPAWAVRALVTLRGALQ